MWLPLLPRPALAACMAPARWRRPDLEHPPLQALLVAGAASITDAYCSLVRACSSGGLRLRPKVEPVGVQLSELLEAVAPP